CLSQALTDLSSALRPPPSSTLFPYTTLFRSYPPGRPCPRACRGRRASSRRSAGACRPPKHGGASSPPSPTTPTWSPSCWAGSRRSEEHTSELQSRENLVCRLLLEKKKDTALT